eukprot:COSAG01_NODE_286_length_19421_cov_123.895663_5_plen_76_part_00
MRQTRQPHRKTTQHVARTGARNGKSVSSSSVMVWPSGSVYLGAIASTYIRLCVLCPKTSARNAHVLSGARRGSPQ